VQNPHCAAPCAAKPSCNGCGPSLSMFRSMRPGVFKSAT
jgi:hypothetical protein